jgi:phosphoserine phosphatase RsbU/P
MTTANPAPTPAEPYTLQCMEIIGGNHVESNVLSSPGLDIWLDSRPFGGDVGGDIHYFSMCGSGRVTRLSLADVSGHGVHMDGVAKRLRDLMRKHINLLDQTRFARAINREFTEMADADYFATVLLITYFAPTDHLIVCNAGHPRPLWYSRRHERWMLLDQETPDTGPSIREARGTYALRPLANLPLGIVEPTDYHQFSVKLEKGDLVVVYTDALIEAKNRHDKPLGEAGLLDLVSQLDPNEPHHMASRVLARVEAYRDGLAPDDDQTLVVLHHNASDPPAMTLRQALKSISRMLGLRRV